MTVSLHTSILGIDFENPFLLASAPPTSLIESIDVAFQMGWAGAVLKTITPDDLEMIEASPRYAVLEDKKRIIGFQNIELLSHKTIKYWCDGIKYLKQKYPTKVIIASIMAPVNKNAWQDLVKTLNDTPADAFELNFSCPHGMPEKGIGMAIAQQDMHIHKGGVDFDKKKTDTSLAWFIGAGFEFDIGGSGWALGFETRYNSFRYETEKLVRNAPSGITGHGNRHMSYISLHMQINKHF